MPFQRWILGLLGLALLVPMAARAEACADSPRAAVERFHDTLLSVMKDAEKLGVRGRYDRLAPVVSACFDLRLMARVSSERGWRDAPDDQRETLVAAFSRMSIATYASQFDGFGGESFETSGVDQGPQETRLVRTRINIPGKAPVPLVYVMKAAATAPSQWRVADILLDGDISQLATRRSEYRATLTEKGLAGLVATLNAKANELLAKY